VIALDLPGMRSLWSRKCDSANCGDYAGCSDNSSRDARETASEILICYCGLQPSSESSGLFQSAHVFDESVDLLYIIIIGRWCF
jgi:hypothetical protein